MKALSIKREYGKLQAFVDEYSRGKKIFIKVKCNNINIDSFKSQFPMTVQALQAIYNDRKRTTTINKSFATFVRNVNCDRLPIFISQLPNTVLIKLFEIDKNNILLQRSGAGERSERKWRTREGTYRQLLKNGTLRSDIAEDAAIKLLHGYYDIRTERNQVNHATAESTTGIGELSSMIEAYLAELEKYRK